MLYQVTSRQMPKNIEIIEVQKKLGISLNGIYSSYADARQVKEAFELNAPYCQFDVFPVSGFNNRIAEVVVLCDSCNWLFDVMAKFEGVVSNTVHDRKDLCDGCDGIFKTVTFYYDPQDFEVKTVHTRKALVYDVEMPKKPVDIQWGKTLELTRWASFGSFETEKMHEQIEEFVKLAYPEYVVERNNMGGYRGFHVDKPYLIAPQFVKITPFDEYGEILVAR